MHVSSPKYLEARVGDLAPIEPQKIAGLNGI
jgi:hypothetical protein